MQDRQKFLQDLARRRYLSMLQYLPKISKEKVREYTTLILTFIALIIFSIFAINPTLSTIFDLKKQISDSQFAVESLKKKLINLNSLSTQYQTLQPDLPILLSALPQTPNVASVVGQVQQLAQLKNVQIVALESTNVSLYPPPKPGDAEKYFIFNVTVQGNYESLISFMTSITTFTRVTSVESVAYTVSAQENQLPKLTIRARAYFLP
jgi:Tfp pilus assembly protein PilO